MNSKILFFAAIIFLSLNSLAQSGNKILLNKTYLVKVIEDPNTKHPNIWEDEVNFKNGKLYFKIFSKNWGFPYAPCTISVDSSSNVITFTSEVKNSTHASRKLSGTINGDAIDGTVEIIRKDGVKRPYTFSGSLKNKSSN
jgi:hypothetical protein